VSLHVPAGSVLAVTSFTLNAVGATGALTSLPVKLLDRTDSIFLQPQVITNWAFMVPLVPLQPSTTYEASFTGTSGGVALTRTWRFTTRNNVPAAAGVSRTGRLVRANFEMPSRAIGSASFLLPGCPASYTVTAVGLTHALVFTETGTPAVAGCTIRVTAVDALTGASVSQDIQPASL